MQLQRDFLSNKFGLEKGIPNHVIKRLLEQQAWTFLSMQAWLSVPLLLLPPLSFPSSYDS